MMDNNMRWRDQDKKDQRDKMNKRKEIYTDGGTRERERERAMVRLYPGC